MRRLLLILALSALAVGAAWWIAGLPGRAAISIGDLSVEATAPVAALLAGLALVLLYVLLRALGFLLFWPRRLRAWRLRRRRAAGDAAVTRALVTIAAADKAGALRAAEKARRLLGDTPQTLLLTAEAARLSGRDKEAEAAYLALARRGDAAFLGLRGLLRQAILREDWPEAARLASRAEAAHPGADWLRDARLQLAGRTGEWQPALALAGPGAPMAALATAASNATTGDEALRLARRAWKADRAFTPAALAYATCLRHEGQEDKALRILRESWGLAPNPALADAAIAPVSDPPSQLRRARDLIRDAARHPESQLLLARLHLANNDLDEARRHAEAAGSAGLHERRLFLLRADIEEATHGDTAEGRTIQRDLLRQAAEAEPDPTWSCTTCGSTQPTWSPTCPTCHTPASLRWGNTHTTPQKPLLIAS
jgi:HemY protein